MFKVRQNGEKRSCSKFREETSIFKIMVNFFFNLIFGNLIWGLLQLYAVELILIKLKLLFIIFYIIQFKF